MNMGRGTRWAKGVTLPEPVSLMLMGLVVESQK